MLKFQREKFCSAIKMTSKVHSIYIDFNTFRKFLENKIVTFEDSDYLKINSKEKQLKHYCQGNWAKNIAILWRLQLQRNSKRIK